jgi:hypothetical protein
MASGRFWSVTVPGCCDRPAVVPGRSREITGSLITRLGISVADMVCRCDPQVGCFGLVGLYALISLLLLLLPRKRRLASKNLTCRRES